MMNKLSKNSIIFSSFLLLIITSGEVISSLGPRKRQSEEVKYRTSFGHCPSRAAGTLALKLMKEFERNHSLRDVKLKMTEDKLSEKHFVSDYKIQYDPLKNFITLQFNCPLPLMKVQIYKKDGQESYDAILVENGELFDPTYEVLLRAEKKLDYVLPFLALPVGEMEKSVQKDITHIVTSMSLDFRKKISEIILSEEKELTVILSISGHPSSVFLGQAEWSDKIEKLHKIVNYMEAQKKVPAIINLMNSKKVVVKFNDKF